VAVLDAKKLDLDIREAMYDVSVASDDSFLLMAYNR
jgi:hypothetical protein